MERITVQYMCFGEVQREYFRDPQKASYRLNALHIKGFKDAHIPKDK